MDVLAAMRVFARVVERGSMSAAARDLGIGQPAVSERIDRLETLLATCLLRRNTRTMSITDAGAAFYERSKRVIEAADEALTIGIDEKPLHGTLRIAAPHGLGEVVVPAILLWLRGNHPRLKIDLVLNDRIVDPVTEGVDVSLRLGDVGDGAFAARRLSHVRRVLVAAPDYLARYGSPVSPSDLVDHPFLRVSGLFNDGRLPLVSDDNQTVPVLISVAFTASHWRPVHALLTGGAGIGVLQEPVCLEDLEQGRLRRLLPEFRVPGLDLHALYSVGRPLPAKIQAVLTLLEEKLPPILG